MIRENKLYMIYEDKANHLPFINGNSFSYGPYGLYKMKYLRKCRSNFSYKKIYANLKILVSSFYSVKTNFFIPALDAKRRLKKIQHRKNTNIEREEVRKRE